MSWSHSLYSALAILSFYTPENDLYRPFCGCMVNCFAFSVSNLLPVSPIQATSFFVFLPEVIYHCTGRIFSDLKRFALLMVGFAHARPGLELLGL